MPENVNIPVEPKSGLVSSEFYATVVFAIVMALVAIGVIPAADAEVVKDELYSVIEKGIALFAALVPVFAYVRGRLALKAAHVSAAAQTTVPVAVPVENYKV